MAKSAMDLARAREKMKEHRLDALIATNEDNVYRASGKPPEGQPEGDRPTYVVIPILREGRTKSLKFFFYVLKVS